MYSVVIEHWLWNQKDVDLKPDYVTYQLSVWAENLFMYYFAHL